MQIDAKLSPGSGSTLAPHFSARRRTVNAALPRGRGGFCGGRRCVERLRRAGQRLGGLGREELVEAQESARAGPHRVAAVGAERSARRGDRSQIDAIDLFDAGRVPILELEHHARLGCLCHDMEIGRDQSLVIDQKPAAKRDLLPEFRATFDSGYNVSC
jgi:hypothetical protein